MEGGFACPLGVWGGGGRYMVVALLMHYLKSIGDIGEMRESNDSLVAFGMEMPLSGVDCPIIESKSLWEPLGTRTARVNYALLHFRMHDR